MRTAIAVMIAMTSLLATVGTSHAAKQGNTRGQGASAGKGHDEASCGEKSACHLTSTAARIACHNEAKDDAWIAQGKCLNVSDCDAREECESEAKDAVAEARQECGEQFDAREDVCEALGQEPYDPEVDPHDFLSPEETAANPNPYFPLVPGATWVYEGPGETITVTVTGDTKEILGVETIVVRDTVVDEDGELIEDTFDWFAQDVDGNVWYFGEIVQNFEDGELANLDGSWQAGVEGAKIGIVMKADPMVGDVYRQEFDLGNAEDVAEVISTTGTATVPAASCNGTCVVTRDFTPIEPDALENKYYAPGVGLILEVDPAAGERVELISVSGL